MSHNTIEEIIQDIQAGKMVIMTDDEARENEGDLILAAGAVTVDRYDRRARRTRQGDNRAKSARSTTCQWLATRS